MCALLTIFRCVQVESGEVGLASATKSTGGHNPVFDSTKPTKPQQRERERHGVETIASQLHQTSAGTLAASGVDGGG